MSCRKVSDTEYRRAYRGDDPESRAEAQKHRAIVRTVLRKYRKVIPRNDLESCGDLAIWKCLQYHDSDHPSRQKFTTSLYRITNWVCLQELRRIRRASRPIDYAKYGVDRPTAAFDYHQDPELEDQRHVVECVGLVPNGDILKEYYLEGETIATIAKKRKIGRRRVRQILNESLEALRELYLDDLV